MVPAVINAINITASHRHCFFDSVMPAKVNGKNNKGSLINMMVDHSCLSSLHIPEIRGIKNNKLIPQNNGTEKKCRTCVFIRGFIIENTMNAIIEMDNADLEKNKLSNIIAINPKMMALL